MHSDPIVLLVVLPAALAAITTEPQQFAVYDGSTLTLPCVLEIDHRAVTKGFWAFRYSNTSEWESVSNRLGFRIGEGHVSYAFCVIHHTQRKVLRTV